MERTPVLPRYILTGTPGAGKTAILRQLEQDGYATVEEAATDVIALQQALGIPEPWRDPGFIDRILDLQHRRQTAADARASGSAADARASGSAAADARALGSAADEPALCAVSDALAQGATADRTARGVVFFDRSPVCTLALSRYLGLAPSRALRDEIDRLQTQRLYDRSVFFVRNLGFVEATAARRISFDEAMAFERLHELAYLQLGFDLVEVPAGPLAARVALVREMLG
ncbi:MAG: AAA family ATPase [Actinoplanes sp.]